MADPNTHCCPMTWDQRIPNEPLLDRQFLITNPPVVVQDYPRSTVQCTAPGRTHPEDRPWLQFNKRTEREATQFWHNNTVSDQGKGVPTQDQNHGASVPKLKTLVQDHPERPWLHGINKNIDRESQLHNLNYYNPRDCIIPCVQRDLCCFNRMAGEKMARQFQSKRLDVGVKMWNNPTSLRMLEPVDYNYTEQVQKHCKKKKKKQLRE